MNIFSSVGDLGDGIALLPSVRAAGGGKMVFTYTPKSCRESLKGRRFDALRPLLESQEYVSAVEWQDNPRGVTHDATNFRQDFIPGESLLHWQARHLKLHISSSPWLACQNNPKYSGRVVVARSERYHNLAFPWRDVLLKYKDAVFVGLPEEHQAMYHATGINVEFAPTENLLELAEIVAGCRLFIGNQSAPMWTALGLGVPIIQETFPQIPNSVLERTNCRYALTEKDFQSILELPSTTSIPSVNPKPKSRMLIVFPFNKKDQHKLEKLLKLMDDFCGPQPFHCLLASPHDDGTEEVRRLAARVFGNKSVNHQIVSTIHDSWPAAANSYFEQVAREIAANVGDPWMWFEPDCAPLTKDALSQIALDYGTYRKDFYGMIAPKGAVREGDTLLGCAIYPAAFYATSTLCRFLSVNAQSSLAAKKFPRPFDAFLMAETTPNCHPSAIMQDAWHSKNYRMDGDRIVFDVETDFGQDKAIRPGVVFLHGCKDDTLVDLMRAKWSGINPVSIKAEPKNVDFHTPVCPVVKIVVKGDTATLMTTTGDTFTMPVEFMDQPKKNAAFDPKLRRKELKGVPFQKLRKLAAPVCRKSGRSVLRMKTEQLISVILQSEEAA